MVFGKFIKLKQTHQVLFTLKTKDYDGLLQDDGLNSSKYILEYCKTLRGLRRVLCCMRLLYGLTVREELVYVASLPSACLSGHYLK